MRENREMMDLKDRTQDTLTADDASAVIGVCVSLLVILIGALACVVCFDLLVVLLHIELHLQTF